MRLVIFSVANTIFSCIQWHSSVNNYVCNFKEWVKRKHNELFGYENYRIVTPHHYKGISYIFRKAMNTEVVIEEMR